MSGINFIKTILPLTISANSYLINELRPRAFYWFLSGPIRHIVPDLGSKDGVSLNPSEQFIISEPPEHKSHFLINELVCIV